MMSSLFNCWPVILGKINIRPLLFNLHKKNGFNAISFSLKSKSSILICFLPFLCSYFVWQEMSSHFPLLKKAICDSYTALFSPFVFLEATQGLNVMFRFCLVGLKQSFTVFVFLGINIGEIRPVVLWTVLQFGLESFRTVKLTWHILSGDTMWWMCVPHPVTSFCPDVSDVVLLTVVVASVRYVSVFKLVVCSCQR